MNKDFNSYLYQARARNAAEHANVSFLSELAQSILTVGLIWSMFPHDQLLTWLIVSVVVSSIVFWVHRAHRPDEPEFSPKKWQLIQIACSFAVGFSWGVVPGVFFAPDNIFYLAFIIALYTGYVSGALSVSFSDQPTFISFTIGITLPFVGRMFYEGGQLYTTIGGLAIFYVVAASYVSRNMHKLFIDATRIQYDNAQLVDELAKQKETAEHAVMTKDRFLAAASHDLRQPLNAISLFTDALRPLQTKPLGNEIVDKVQQSLKGLNGMLHSLLNIAELDAGSVQNRPKHLSLYTLVESIVTEYQDKAGKLELLNEVDRDLVVFCDQTILYRIVRNLLDNAVKYTEQGQVIIECEHKANACELCIRDSGIGIPQNQIDLVFDEFHQLNNPERDRAKGLGLGLAIVKRLCDLASIDIKLTSQTGEGSTVILTLATGLETAVIKNGNEAPISFSGELIVVIDDERDIRQAMQLILTALDAEVVAAESLDQAMQELAQISSPPSVIVSDFRLRDNATGAQVIEAICEEYNREIPSIIITGDTRQANLSEMREAADCVLYKPVDTIELQESIAGLIRLKES